MSKALKKGRCKLGKLNKNNGIFVLHYFIELRKNIFFLKEDQGGPPVTLNDILKKSISTRVLIRLGKLMKGIKSFLSRTPTASY